MLLIIKLNFYLLNFYFRKKEVNKKMEHDAGSLTPPITLSSSQHKASPEIDRSGEPSPIFDIAAITDGLVNDNVLSDAHNLTEDKNDLISISKKSIPVFGKDKAKKFLKALGSQKKYHSENQSKRSNATSFQKSTKISQSKNKGRVEESTNSNGDPCSTIISETLPTTPNNNKILNKDDGSPANSYLAAGSLEALKAAYDDTDDCLDTEKTEEIARIDREMSRRENNWSNKGNRFDAYDSRRNGGKMNHRSMGSYEYKTKTNNIKKMTKDCNDFHYNQPHERKNWRFEKIGQKNMLRNRANEHRNRSLSQQPHFSK